MMIDAKESFGEGKRVDRYAGDRESRYITVEDRKKISQETCSCLISDLVVTKL